MNQKNPNELDFARDLDFSEVLTNPILDIAARLWEEDRYQAFQVCYRSMRRIDDFVDDRKEEGRTITTAEVEEYGCRLVEWLEAVRRGDDDDPFRRDFLDVLRRFAIPFWPWERLHHAMIYDLKHIGYRSLRAFLKYAEGAAVAPASVFMHLCGVARGDDGYCPPKWDIRYAARPLALFSYLVHIIRDFQQDQLHNLNYFADSELSRFGLDHQDLRDIAAGGPISRGFRDLIARYRSFGEYYRGKARQRMHQIMPHLQPRYQLSFEMIYQLYLQIFERIDPQNGTFCTGELNPEPSDVQARISRTIGAFAPASR